MSAVVFTAILGASDSLKPAPTGADHCLCFTDDVSRDSQGWQFVKWPATENTRREAWRIRCLSHQVLPMHDISVWVDASFTVTDLPRLLKDAEGHELSAMTHHRRTSCYAEGLELIRIGQAEAAAVEHQLALYRRAHFAPTSLSIGCVVARANTPRVQRFNGRWQGEIAEHPGDNCQLSFDYCAWMSGVTVHALAGTRKENPYAVHDHEDHKHRRKPYRVMV